MEIKRAGSQPSAKGPAEWLPATCASIRFFRRPIRAWSRRQRDIRTGCADGVAHPSAWTDADRNGGLWLGATRRRTWSKRFGPGDVVWFPPGEKHWHGATPTTGMTHIAIQEKLNGKVVEWMEHVTDDQYRK